MKTLNGGIAARSGHYLHLGSWEIVPVSAGGGVLPGARRERYVRLPTVAVLALAPVLGGLFLMFLPVVGIVLTATALVRRQPAESEAAVLSPSADAS